MKEPFNHSLIRSIIIILLVILPAATVYAYGASITQEWPDWVRPVCAVLFGVLPMGAYGLGSVTPIPSRSYKPGYDDGYETGYEEGKHDGWIEGVNDRITTLLYKDIKEGHDNER
ncbi:hypothetical protein [Bifidobacterium tissieri]|uniref:Uncharacterized protein n=1 Tax=Bifidobacterium tissieri TaxID=1630162 RepID=A0A5M9ZVH6_9BIFI|nr:hypothetical protein [Bifidobacterium tissieri]KAA8828668.1 hypothetical protein EM849_11565 [Bifidobacterium tissieri]KAA8831611.1 hypothetical protein EMO89_02480 [Bifidobacterium tissieri]